MPDAKIILLVEDDTLSSRYQQTTLEKLGYIVIAASSGQEAIDAVLSHLGIDLVLMDIDLGAGIDGAETADIILRDRDIPIVFVSSHTEKEVLERTEKVTSYGCVVKGSTAAVLGASLRMAFRLHEAHRQLREKEKRLAMSEGRLKKAQAISHVGNWELDVCTNRISASEEAFRIFGVEPTTSDISRNSVAELLLPQYRPALGLAFERLVRGEGPYDEEFEIRRIDNHEVRFISSKAELISVDGMPVVVAGVIQDITARKKGEDALLMSRTQLAEAAKMAGLAHWEADQKTNVFTFNDAYYDLLGTTVEKEGSYQMSFDNYVDRFGHPDDRPRIDGFVDALRNSPHIDGPLDVEGRIIRADGDVRHIATRLRVVRDPAGEPAKVFGVNQDITDRKRAEETLRQSEERYRRLFETANEGIVAIDRGHVITLANERFAEMVGWNREDLIGASIAVLLFAEDLQVFAENGKRYSQGGSDVMEWRVRRKDGTPLWFHASMTPLLDAGGAFAGAFAMFTDITGRKRAEEDKRRLEDQLRHAQKMEAIGTLAGGVAHDFNNLLTVILGFAQLIQVSTGESDETRPYIDQIVESANRAADLTRSLLAFSRKQRIEVAPHAMNDVVTGTAAFLKRLLPEDIMVVLDLTNADLFARIDVTQMDQVLMNLAGNARDAMPHGGSLTITTRKAQIDTEFIQRHGFGRAGEYVRLSVADTGIGMDSLTQGRIFEPFFTTKEVGKGTGLGLASTYGIVKQHSGYITVSSVPHQGTTFDIYLPLVGRPSKKSAIPEDEPQKGTEAILVVEDDEDVHRMLTTILRNQGYTVIEASDGVVALQAYEEYRSQIKLVILDVVMPGRNGKEVFDEIARIDPSVKAIFMSGYAGDVVLTKGVERQVVDFLQKPISVKALLAKVREVLDR
jgi:PAS domain S-box-containing protein